uniref:Uncharacterized protein LOC104235878 n=1 Tax=Nicotiana sylvestris TaxID=4096 RepID=A0A1U7XAX6_NICSY|nr:PREDICTED: uncharacterized protein LOC104235878 [Nicotiana sylvestris]
MERRSWKYLSQIFGWKIKTHGFLIHGVSPASVSSVRLTVSLAQERILSSKRKVDGARGSEGEEELEEGSLVRRPRVRRRVISDDEVTPPPSSVPLNEPASATLVSSDEEMNALPRDFTDQLFFYGFNSKDFGPVSEELTLAPLPSPVPIRSQSVVPVAAATAPPVATFTSSTVLVSTTSHVEIGTSNSNRVMKKVTIEVPEGGNLLKKSGQVDIWLKPLLGPVKKSKLESHSSLTWMNDIVHSSLKINLIGTELMKRIVHISI